MIPIKTFEQEAASMSGQTYIPPWEMNRILKMASGAMDAMCRGTKQPSYSEMRNAMILLSRVMAVGEGNDNARP